jgi:hypothetical protein
MKKLRTLVVATIAASALALPAATASAAPVDGPCVSKGVKALKSLGNDVIPGAAQAGLVSTVILDHLNNPSNYEWCR